ncbi:MAG: PrsW family intramembrane metalloprotease [Polyangiaceae bacterium]|nr:PrsW family intramembrane metalloprotease [Polyangiaceae bacterium]
MRVTSALLALLAAAVPIVGYFVFLRLTAQRRDRLLAELGTTALGVIAFALCFIAETALQRWSGLQKHTSSIDLAVLLYAFVVAAPLEQAMKVAAVVPALRSRHFHEPVDGLIFASASALGFACASNAVYLATQPPSGMALLRASLSLPAHLFFAGAWGYVLGRDPKKRLGGRRFEVAWFGAFLFNGVYDHLLFAHGSGALLAALPMLLCIGVAIVFAARDLLRRGAGVPASLATSRRGILSFGPTSMAAVREALLHSERPILARWIGFGALVTVGVITAMLVGAVALGNTFGVDFSAIDRAEGAKAVAVPLVLLGSAALLAFPVAGYLIARASGAHSMIEPAIAAGLAILGTLVLLGLAAPISVVFALAFAPIAFGLACAGAWVGMTR